MDDSEITSFSTLPNEILLLIARHLDDSLDCLHLASCCQRLYALVLPQVYTTIEFKKLCPLQLSLLAHTLLQSPRLARTVRVLSVGSGYRCQCSCCSDGIFVRYDHEVVMPAVEEVCDLPKQRSMLIDALDADVEYDSWVTLMLPFLPELERLHCDFLCFPFSLWRLLDSIPGEMRPADTTPWFSKLTEVSLNCLDSDFSEWSDMILSIFWLPSLRKFSGRNIVDIFCDDDSDEDDRPSGFSSVTHIELLASYSDSDFENVIRACAHLESFIYDYADNIDWPLDPTAFYPALYDQKETLGELTLVSDNSNGEINAEAQLMEPLSDFPVSKKIRVKACNLLGSDNVPLVNRLPGSLESLRIDDTHILDHGVDELVLVNNLRHMIAAADSRFPGLTRLEMEDSFCVDCGEHVYAAPEYIEALENLTQICRDAEIGFHIVDRHDQRNESYAGLEID